MGVISSDSGVLLSGPAAFGAFYEQALPLVYSYLFHRCGGGAAVAEDLTQETFMAAVAEIKRGSPIDAPIPWVMGIAKHKLLDHYRMKEREERRLVLAFESRRTGEDWAGEISRERALAALDRLPTSQRAVLVLRYLDALSVPEVAHAVGKSVRATESLLARGRESFKRVYQEADHE